MLVQLHQMMPMIEMVLAPVLVLVEPYLLVKFHEFDLKLQVLVLVQVVVLVLVPLLALEVKLV